MKYCVFFLSLTISLTVALGGAAQTRLTNPTVVELYTSQGCGMCPPADALLAELAQHPNVLGLSLHVTYWDYRGWRDPFSLPSATARQEAYAAFAVYEYVYTPQFIVNGVHEFRNLRDPAVTEALLNVGNAPQDMPLEVAWEGNRVVIAPLDTTPLPAPLALWRITFLHNAETQVTAGYNAGRALVNQHIVTQIEALEDWSGIDSRAVPLASSAEQGQALLVQSAQNGAIWGAVALMP
jgi:hypothetical protein